MSWNKNHTRENACGKEGKVLDQIFIENGSASHLPALTKISVLARQLTVEPLPVLQVNLRVVFLVIISVWHSFQK